MTDWRSMHASGPDRERAADLLRTAHGDGRLAWPEYSARLERLMASTTHGELHQVVGDLITESARQGSDGDPARAQRYSGTRVGGDLGLVARQPPVTRGRGHPAHQIGTERLASAAILCGTLVPFTVGISGIPAILLGHLARRRLKRAPQEAVGGNSAQMATAALVLGYLPLLIGLGVAVFLLTR